MFFKGAFFAAGPAYVPIAAARQQRQGTTVTVLGLVSVPSGDFSSSSADEGFALQDQTGGIWVSVKKNPHLHDGQRVEVTGGFGNQYDTTYEVYPRSREDIEALPAK